MDWYWIATIAGVVAPWLIMARQNRIGFEERGFAGGLAIWIGTCIITAPLMLLLAWIGSLIF
jgi:hypothetical protein